MATFELPKKIRLQIVTPERSLVDEKVDEVYLPGELGYLGILPGHTPLLSSLKIGVITYKVGPLAHYLFVSWGFVEVLPDRVTVLADIAEAPEDIDVPKAEKARDEAQAELKKLNNDLLAAQIALEQALVRMQVAAKAAPLTK